MPLHRSPGLPLLLREIADLDKPKVLDLGAPCTSLLRFFAERKCKLYFEDLPDALFDDADAAASLEQNIEHHLLDYGDTCFDLVLGWDLFNYLELPAVAKLMARINRHCRPDTLFHMIRYRGPNIPRRPRRFRVDASQQLAFETGELAPRAIAAHSTVRLLQHMTDQFMEGTLMDEAGMQPSFVEHVLRYRPTRRHRKQKQSSPRTRSVNNANAEDRRPAFHSPGLELICHHLAQRRKPKLLVIGKHAGGDYLDTLNGEVYTEDFLSSLRWRESHQRREGMEQKAELISEGRHYPTDTQFDAVIAWDLFNYCSPDQIEAVGDWLGRFCNAHTLLYFLSYTHAHIPAQPRAFELLARGRIGSPQGGATVPRGFTLTAAGLMKLLPQFYVKNTFVNRPRMLTGACEYVLEYMPPAALLDSNKAAAAHTVRAG